VATRILLMDDEEMVCTIAEKLLDRLDCSTECARNGEDAVVLYQNALNSDSPFDYVILDLSVPGGMGARETVEELKKIDPHVKAIVSSGYSSDDAITDYTNFGFVAAIVKPFKLEDLQSVLAEATQ
jgi:two-component system cell cycle sensor histidine kinase/response regulator CckA